MSLMRLRLRRLPAASANASNPARAPGHGMLEPAVVGGGMLLANVMVVTAVGLNVE